MSRSQCKDGSLFVYLSWRTRDKKPLLADEQIRQAVSQAITTRARTQFCHTLAVSGTDTEVHAIFRFPASLQVSCIARMSMQAAAEAVTQLSEILYARQIHPAIWETHFTSQTLSAGKRQKPRPTWNVSSPCPK